MLLRFIALGVSLTVAAGLLLQVSAVRSWVADQAMPFRHGVKRLSNIMVPMRDGVHLSTTVLLPVDGNGPYPTILTRTTYGWTDFGWHKFFVRNGYVVVVQYVRGREGSEGRYSPHRHSRNDGYDTIDWIVSQDWSDGKVGTFGCSYMGESQNILAASRHPNHIAMISDGGGGAIGSAMGSYGYFGVYENGVLNLASALGWFTEFGAKIQSETEIPDDYQQRLGANIHELPVAELGSRVVPFATGFDDLHQYPLTDNWWREEGYITDDDRFSAATLHVNTWFDQTVHDTFRLAALMERNADHPRARQQHLLIGPGLHCTSGDFRSGLMKVGELAFEYRDIDYPAVYLDWFDYWLKGRDVDLPPKIRYFRIHNSDWAQAATWPPDGVRAYRLYLSRENDQSRATGDLRAVFPDEQPPDVYVYDPDNPVPTIGGTFCCTGRDDALPGSVDQKGLHDRADVLFYQSEVLHESIEIVGSVRAMLRASSSAPDTDFTLKLIDVFPDGRAFNLHDGVVRLRYREGIDKPRLAEPGQVYPLELELRPIAYTFRAGHRIAIQVSSSNFPRLARNLNTGEHEYFGFKRQKAENRVYHDPRHLSYIELPVLDQSTFP